MARIKLAYIGGGSTRAAGTMASFIAAGRELRRLRGRADRSRRRASERRADASREKMARARGLDLTITATTDRRDGLRDCDAVLTSFRPGGFEARYLDESIPLKHGVIGQETQGPGGFFMALRSIHVMQGHHRGYGGGLPQRSALQLHQSRQHRLRGGDAPYGDPDRLALRGADRHQPRVRVAGRTRSRPAGCRLHRPQSWLVVGAPPLRGAAT